MLSPFLVSHLKIPYPIPLPPAHYPWPLIPLHWGIEPSQDQGPFFPLMSDKAILCYICGWSHGSLHVYSGWWFTPWKFWGYWLVHIVVPPMGLQTPSAPWVLSLAPPLGTLSSVQWASTSVIVGNWNSLSGDSYIRLQSASTSWHP
jgi:hypothetical protein